MPGPSINAYGGGGTTIKAGFRRLSERLLVYDKATPTTVLFVSDGADTTGNGIKSIVNDCAALPWPTAINFICWGIGRGFPTELAMGIREKLHTGPTSSPPVILMDNSSRPYDDLSLQSDQIKQYIRFTKSTITPAVFTSPWDTEGSLSVGSGSLVFVPAGCEWVEVDGVRVDLCDEEPQMETVLALVRAWTSSLQLLSMKEPFATSIRPKGMALLAWIDAINEDRLRRRAERKAKRALLVESVAERMGRKLDRGEDLAWSTIHREARQLAEGNVLSDLSDADKAQRLKIGTVTGKYHQKALDLKGINSEDFSRMRKSFVSVLAALAFPPSYVCSQAQSILSLENTWDVLQQPDLVAAVDGCESQFEWVECFPLIGDGVFWVRSNASMINPFAIHVKSVPRIVQVIDSLCLVLKGNEMTFGEETVNAIVPLFSASDAVLAPVLSSALFKLLVHFQVVGNVDTYDSMSYLAALSALWTYFAALETSSFRAERMQKVVDTALLAYGGNKAFEVYCSLAAAGDPRCLVTDHPSNQVGGVYVKCESLQKLFLATATQASRPTGAAAVAFASRIVVEFFSRAMSSDLAKYFVFPAEECAAAAAAVVEKIKTETYYTLREMRDAALAASRALKLVFPATFSLKMDEVERLSTYNLTFHGVVAAIRELLGAAAAEAVREPAHIARMLASAYKNSSSYDRNVAPLLDGVADEDVTEMVKELMVASFRKSFETVEVPRLQEHFSAQMKQSHESVFPLTREQLRSFCLEKGVPIGSLRRSRSGLLRNACAARDCPFFLQPSLHMHEHIVDAFGYRPMYAGHVTICEERDQAPRSIIADIRQGKCLNNRETAFPLYRSTLESGNITTGWVEAIQAVYLTWSAQDLVELELDSNAEVEQQKNFKFYIT